MVAANFQAIRLHVFPRMFDIPNLSPFCSKLETWLRMAQVPYEVVETRDPRKAPRRKLPFIEDDGRLIADSSVIIEHLSRTRSIDLDASLGAIQHATALLVKRTVEEHYSFVLAYTHLVHEEGVRHTRTRFEALPFFVRPLVERAVRKNVKTLLWYQGLLRCPHDEVVANAIEDWRAILAVMSGGPFFFGDQATTLDATVFSALASTILTPIETPIRSFLRSQPKAVAYAERMRDRFFPELSSVPRAATRSSLASAHL